MTCVTAIRGTPELTLTNLIAANGRRRLVYSVSIGGRQVGTATEWTGQHCWSLTIPGGCAGYRCPTRNDLLNAVERMVRSGQFGI